MKPAYLVQTDGPYGQPHIVKADVANVEATDWRTAKKVLRKWYLDKAASLRKVKEKDYFIV